MLWISVAIFSYFLLAWVAVIDRYLLKSPIPSPKIYTFYVGVLSISAVFLFPFFGFPVPSLNELFLCLLAGTFNILGIFGLFSALSKFEASRVIPAMGGFTSLFTFSFSYLFSGEFLAVKEILAFILLALGSFFITFEKDKTLTKKSLQIVVITAFFFSSFFILAKFVYLNQPFWTGFIWLNIGSFFISLLFLLFREVKEELFRKKIAFKLKIAKLFLFNRILNAGGGVLQNWAIALAPFGFLSFINALQGIEYVFVLLITVFLSLKFPRILSEEISQKVILQKIISVLLIGIGLIILTV